MAEISSIEEKNIKLERQVADLQIEVNQYRSNLNENSSASTKLTNSISNLRREAESYQSELNQARDELRNATEKIQQIERKFSDTKKTDQKLIDTTGFLNDKILNLTNILESKESDVRKMETKMAEFSSIEEKNNKLERQITDLQTEINRYERDFNDKSSASAKLTNTISNLRREVETYQRELNQARDKLKNATENNQQMERRISDLKKSDQAFINERGCLNDKIQEFTNILKRKDSDVRKMETKLAEISSIEEKNIKLERQVADLQIEVNQYRSNLNENSSASTKLINTISNLRREAETYQSELIQARDELRNATEKIQLIERQFSDTKKTDQKLIDTTGFLNDKILTLTNILERKESDVRKMETQMAEFSSIEEKNNKLERQVTDLQTEVNRYKSDLNDKSSASAKLTNTISNLRCEVETYQSELNQERDELKNATENNQQMERQISNLKKSDQTFVNERGCLNDKIQELTNILKRRDSDVRKMETKMAEISSIEEKNIKLERQVADLQIEVNQYRSDLNENSSASAKLINTISNLRREAETYQSELIQARDELRNATEKIQQIERKFSDTKKTYQKVIDETGFLNDKILNSTNILQRKESDVRKMETKMAECSSIEEKNNKLERQVTDLQTEINRYERDLNDKSSASTKLTNTISNLRREAETHQSELNQVRDELKNATEKIQLIERQISDLKRSEQALIDERGSLNDNIRQLTDILKGKDSDIRKIEKELAEYSLIKEENAKAERQITDLQIEIKQYKSELKDKSDNLTKQTNTFSNLSHESERCKSELKEAHEKIRKLNLQLKTVNDEQEKCNHLISSLRKENAKLSMYKDNDQTRRSEATLSQREHELSLALEKSRRELREAQHELDDTKTRLWDRN
ncbi:putative leucine-rich repeat-containing protein DDB_G0290503 isoform X2 [Mya arenaria]|uniref:putative leucine-rich repeat-containing protein DDB_G0290503 isoform X2 n=1 Tax=Mya arenaria TaxID=6604 RepID=UPI0022E8D695|nr:putative leucine-rich repeat-containing protein DDB_G0290503 isoform X2 [Mya arenaria]